MAKKRAKKALPRGSSRSWQDIQQLGPRGQLSPLAKRKRWWDVLRVLAGVLLAVLVLAGAWWGIQWWSEYAKTQPVSQGGETLKQVLFETDGVLDEAWLGACLRLPRGVDFELVDIFELQRQVREDSQVREVTIKRVFPNQLEVLVFEYFPMCRIRGRFPGGEKREVLVSQDGHVYTGKCYDAAFLAGLPLLEEVTLEESESGELSVPGAETVSRLLFELRTSWPEFFKQCRRISLAAFDGREGMPWNVITVKSNDVAEIIFATDSFDAQIIRLKEVVRKQKERQEWPLEKVDLSVGKNVYVKVKAGAGGEASQR